MGIIHCNREHPLFDLEQSAFYLKKALEIYNKEKKSPNPERTPIPAGYFESCKKTYAQVLKEITKAGQNPSSAPKSKSLSADPLSKTPTDKYRENS